MSGDMIKADEALKLGLVNYVVSQDELQNKTDEIFAKILKQSPVAIAGVISCVNAYYDYNADGFATEAKEFGKCFATEDFKEGTTAFMEKRKANFPGK